MQSDYKCPFCHGTIGLADVNVATDVALCRTCGKTSAFSMISGTAEISFDALATIPRGIKVANDFRSATRIVYRKVSAVVLFLIPFTAAWSGLSMWGIYGTQFKKGRFEIGLSLFGLPFLIGTIILVSLILFLLFGKWVVTLDHGEGSVFAGIGPVGRTRRFRYNRGTVVSMRMTNVRINQMPQKGILVRTDGKDFVFGTALKDDAKRYIASAIMRELSKA